MTLDELQRITMAKPFRAFEVRLNNGEVIYVTERFRAVAHGKEFAVTTDGRHLRHIPLTQVVSATFVNPGTSASGSSADGVTR